MPVSLPFSESISVILPIDLLQLQNLSLPFAANVTVQSLDLSFILTHLCFLCLPDVARAIELLEKLQESGDVPGHKLQSLKKVLQSEFCTAIREVGHMIYNEPCCFLSKRAQCWIWRVSNNYFNEQFYPKTNTVIIYYHVISKPLDFNLPWKPKRDFWKCLELHNESRKTSTIKQLLIIF